MTVRSTRIFGPTRTTAANTSVTVYTVPAGHTLIIRSWSAWAGGGTCVALLVLYPVADGAAATIRHLDVTNDKTATSDSWIALRPGDVLKIQSSTADTYFAAFGALLVGAGPI